jgi:MipA family protein
MQRAILILSVSLAATPALGQSRPDNGRVKGAPQFVAAGVGMTSKYSGASDYKIIPFGGARVRVPGGNLLVQGPGLTYSYRLSDAVELGPTLYFKGSRKADTGDAVVNLLDPLDSSLELGGFVKYSFPGIGGRANQFDLGLSAGQDLLGGHGGFRAQLSAGHSWRWRSGMFVRAGVGLSFADANYMNSSFGITSRGSVATGLPVYTPGGGLEDMSASTSFNIPVSGRWSLFGTLSYSRLLTKATDSPFVRTRGSADQGLGGLSLAYSF